MSPSSAAILAVLLGVAAMAVAAPPPPVAGGRAFFVFGDSLVDSGNNNYLATTARADSPPYGIDYPTHRPTGRFCNGYNIPDLISLAIGTEPTLPYFNPELRGEKLLVGANFASAGIGILNDTGFQFANIIRIHKQFKLFQEYKRRVSALTGEEQMRVLVNKALVLIMLGGNDFVNNYYLTPVTVRRLQFSNLQDYCQYLISEYKPILRNLYDLGARRVLVTGIGPIGCTPAEIALRGVNGRCAEEPQRATAIYDPLLAKMVASLNQEIGSDIFIATLANFDFISNPRAYGFLTSNNACCGQGPYNGLGLCIATSNLCQNRDEYVFWDAFHPTERANRFIVRSMLDGSGKSMIPMNLSTIMELDSRT